jgi:hypothetical protein
MRGVMRGYATVAMDNGHQSGDDPFDMSWALGEPPRIVDFGYRAEHIRVGLDASSCPYCCHACRQIQTGCGERYFRKMRYHLALGIQVERGSVEHMLVHSDETGKHRVTS